MSEETNSELRREAETIIQKAARQLPLNSETLKEVSAEYVTWRYTDLLSEQQLTDLATQCFDNLSILLDDSHIQLKTCDLPASYLADFIRQNPEHWDELNGEVATLMTAEDWQNIIDAAIRGDELENSQSYIREHLEVSKLGKAEYYKILHCLRKSVTEEETRDWLQNSTHWKPWHVLYLDEQCTEAQEESVQTTFRECLEEYGRKFPNDDQHDVDQAYLAIRKRLEEVDPQLIPEGAFIQRILDTLYPY